MVFNVLFGFVWLWAWAIGMLWDAKKRFCYVFGVCGGKEPQLSIDWSKMKQIVIRINDVLVYLRLLRWRFWWQAFVKFDPLTGLLAFNVGSPYHSPWWHLMAPTTVHGQLRFSCDGARLSQRHQQSMWFGGLGLSVFSLRFARCFPWEWCKLPSLCSWCRYWRAHASSGAGNIKPLSTSIILSKNDLIMWFPDEHILETNARVPTPTVTHRAVTLFYGPC